MTEVNMKKEILTSKNICIALGVIFGSLIILCNLFFIPSTILLLIGGIQSLEMTTKKKKAFESLVDLKLKSYEQTIKDLKSDSEKFRADLESFKLRQNVSAAFGLRT